MSKISLLCLKMQIETFTLQCEGIREYGADWLKNVKTVTRDASGRFASKANDTGVGDRIQKAASKTKRIAGQLQELQDIDGKDTFDFLKLKLKMRFAENPNYRKKPKNLSENLASIRQKTKDIISFFENDLGKYVEDRRKTRKAFREFADSSVSKFGNSLDNLIIKKLNDWFDLELEFMDSDKAERALVEFDKELQREVSMTPDEYEKEVKKAQKEFNNYMEKLKREIERNEKAANSRR